jgi:hypothetical protein
MLRPFTGRLRRRLGYGLLVGCLILASSSGRGVAQKESPLDPVPDAAAQAKAEKLVKDLFKEDYGKAGKDPAAGRALALLLVKQLPDNKDDRAMYFVMLREIRDLASASGDLRLTLSAINDMSRGFRIDAQEMKYKILVRVAAGAKTPAVRREVCNYAAILIDLAVDKDDYAAAEEASKAALTAMQTAKTEPAFAKADWRNQEIQEMRKEYAKVKEQLKAVANKEADAKTKLAAGRFLAFYKGDWPSGLALLAQGSDDKLKTLAQKDRSVPAKPADRVEVADGWWDLAEQEPDVVKRALRRRALLWYRQAVAQITGLHRARIEKRITQIVDELPIVVGEFRRLDSPQGHSLRTVFSPDGGRLLTAELNQGVRLLDTLTGRLLRQFKGHSGIVYHALFSPDGRQVLSAGQDKTVRLWDVDSGKELHNLAGHTAEVFRVAFLPDGRRALSCGRDKTIRLWDLTKGQQLHVFNGHGDSVHDVAVSADGRHAFTVGGLDKTVRQWEVDTGTEVKTFAGAAEATLAVAVSPDGRLVAATGGGVWKDGKWTSGTDHRVRLWEIASGKELSSWEGHKDQVWGLAFSPDGKRLLSSSKDKTIRLWDVAKGKLLQVFEGHTAPSSGAYFSPDGRWAVSSAPDRTMRLWELPK